MIVKYTCEGIKMLNIVVCSDDDKVQETLSKKIDIKLKKLKIQYEVRIYKTNYQFWYDFEDNMKGEIVFLDGENDSMAILDKIHTSSEYPIVIVIGELQQYEYEALSKGAFRVLQKIDIDKWFDVVMDDALKKIDKSKNEFYFINNRQFIGQVRIQHIVKIWKEEKYAIFLMQNGKVVKIRKTLKQVYDELEGLGFIWIDRTCICNVKKISRIEKDMLILDDNSSIPMAKGRIKSIKSSYEKWCNK